MTSSLSVPRPSNAYGLTSYGSAKQCSWTIRYGTSLANTTTLTTSVPEVGFRDTPTKGVMSKEGFRYPTSWFMVADRMIDHGADYICRKPSLAQYGRYKKTGDEFAGNTVARKGNSPYNTGSKTVSVPAFLTTKSETKALNKIKDSHVDLGVALGEAKTTIAHLTSTVVEVYQVIREARRGRFDKLRKRFGSKDGLGSTWLEYQYGWLPLLSDVYGLQEQLKSDFKKVGSLIKTVGNSTQPWLVTDGLPLTPSGSIGNTTNTHKANKAFYRSKVVLWCRVSNEQLLALNQLGLTNPLLIAWELTTLSFVIDWFIPLGDFIESLSATLGTSFVAGFEDRIAYGDFEAEGNYQTYVSGRKGRVQRRVYAFERRVYPAFPTPGIRFGDMLSTRKLISALALINQMAR